MSAEPARGQTFQFLPEADVYYRVQQGIRFNFQAKETREAGDPTQAEIGPSVDLFLKPLIRLQDVSTFDLDDAKSRPLDLCVGYHYVPSPDKPPVQRTVLALTFHFPLPDRILFSDRNRSDLDWSQNHLTWRFSQSSYPGAQNQDSLLSSGALCKQ